MKYQTLCLISIFMVTLMTANGLRVKKQAGICAAAGVPAVSTDVVVDTVDEVVEQPRAVDQIVAFVEETTVATPEEIAELVNEVANTPEEAHELAELIAEVVEVVEVHEQEISTGTAIETATEVVEGHHATGEVVAFIEETTVSTPEEIAEFVAEVTTNPGQAEELTEVLYETIEVVETAPEVFEELHEEVIHGDLPPVEVVEVVETHFEVGEATWVGGPGTFPVYQEEAERIERVERPENIGGNSLPPVEYHESSEEVTEVITFSEVGEPTFVFETTEQGFEEAPERVERTENVGENSLPPVEYYETTEVVAEVIENPEAVHEVAVFITETTVATPEEVAELVNEVAHTTEEAREIAEIIAETVTVVEVHEQEISTGTAIETATEVVEGHHATGEVVAFIEETTVSTPEEIAEFVAEVTTNPGQAEELTEVLYETIEVVEVVENVGENSYYHEERTETVERPEVIVPIIVGGNPATWGPGPAYYENTEVITETITSVIENPEAIHEVVAFIEETTLATPEEVAELIAEVAQTTEEAHELAELIAEVVNVVEVHEQDVSTGTAIETATEVVEGHHATGEVVAFIEETTIATPAEIAEFVAEVTTTPGQAQELTEVLYETIEVVDIQPPVVTLPVVVDDTPAFCH